MRKPTPYQAAGNAIIAAEALVLLNTELKPWKAVVVWKGLSVQGSVATNAAVTATTASAGTHLRRWFRWAGKLKICF